jgi:hypothetical protein
MKKIFTILSLLLLSGFARINGQSFHVYKDTINVSSSGNIVVVDTIYNMSSSAQNIEWKIVSSNFPASWQSATQFCDMCGCFPWSVATSTNSCSYAPFTSSNSDFHLQANLTTVPAGCYYVKVKFNTTSVPVEYDSTVFVVCKFPTGAATVVKSQEDVVLYPNPATNELNVVYAANADIKNIAVYNIIGKALIVYKVSGNSANLNLENIPSGIYFVRLMNSHGEVVVTKKFTKQ